MFGYDLDVILMTLVICIASLPGAIILANIITDLILFKYRNPADRRCRFCGGSQNLFETSNGFVYFYNWEHMGTPKDCICRRYALE